MQVGTKVKKIDLLAERTYKNAKEDFERQERLHSIWAEPDTPSPWEVIRGSSYCAVKANIPRLFKEVED